MLYRNRKPDLFALRRTGFWRMAFVTIHSLPGSMVGVAENIIEDRTGPLCDTRIRRHVMARIARADIALLRMACKALRMCRNARRNRLRRARRAVTRRTSLSRPRASGGMLRVVEHHIETLVESCRKWQHFIRLCRRSCMAYRADL